MDYGKFINCTSFELVDISLFYRTRTAGVNLREGKITWILLVSILTLKPLKP